MSLVRIAAFSVSLDGFGAGPRQALEHPLGVRGLELHRWLFGTATFKAMHGESGGTEGIDNNFARRSFEDVGAWVLGRNMFGPIRGPWKDETWRGWWGENPPFHTPVFVFTHHPRPPLTMQGGTTFYFVTESLHNALTRAKEVADGKDVRLGGGVATVRQALIQKLVDEVHLALSPVFLGEGESLFFGLNLSTLGFGPPTVVPGENATHVLLSRKLPNP